MTNWIKIRIHTSTAANDILCGRLLDFGIRGFEINDPEEFREFLENKEGKWDYIDDDLLKKQNEESMVTVYVPDNAQGLEMFALIKEMIAQLRSEDTEGFYGSLEMDTDDINEEDWANNWKKYFRTFNVGSRLMVKPSWEDTDNPENRRILEIDPESSFGTGQHHTTKLCLEFLDAMELEGCNLLDMGCGSGILSIAAMLLGAEKATAVDVEENAVRIARQNAEKNHIPADSYSLYCGNVTDDEELSKKVAEGGKSEGYDLITANIVADVLKAMTPLFSEYIKQGGILIASGIIEEREQEVCDAIKAGGFDLLEAAHSGGWAALKFAKN